MEHYGAHIITVEGDCVNSEARARREADERGMVLVHPYNDMQVMAGQGTIGIELNAVQNVAAVFLSVGGGGIVSGVGTAIKPSSPIAWSSRATPPTRASCMRVSKLGGHWPQMRSTRSPRCVTVWLGESSTTA
mmetsp:Transcript_15101/g.43305  ORF Transcript_15101/g.43305 Transcript_15101/m.43305 type:complete len:133 (+) Transcript_15101:328-726(+)